MSMEVTDEMVEQAAEGLYASGPWGSFHAFVDGGVHAITDAHSMTVYRQIAREVLVGALHGDDRDDRPLTDDEYDRSDGHA